MSQLGRFAFVGNSLPRRCGIATFTTDLQQAIERLPPYEPSGIVAMTDHDRAYDYPPTVRLQIDDRRLGDYERAADVLNRARCEVVSLQHEFGIFGGEAGGHIMALATRLAMPLVTTFHTVLSQPTPAQRRVLCGIADASSRVIVMAEKGRELLRTVYQVAAGKIEVIPHGTPDCAFEEPDGAKSALGFDGRPVILTFGLLSPSKGIEVMIDAMPEVLKSNAAAVYVVLGATHPNLIRDQGESYRSGLMARVRALGIEKHVVFLDRFVDQATLLRFISMCDVYATPYLNEAQLTSGTLAYSFGLGKAVVSTPYWHARELLADGRGVLVPFGDVAALGRETAGLLRDGPRRLAMRKRAYAESRPMTWPRIAERYRTLFESTAKGRRLRLSPRHDEDASAPHHRHQVPRTTPIRHFLSLCDDTGLLQHAAHSVANRSHGYCTDDNARALLLACALGRTQESPLPETLMCRFAAFLQHAWNPDTKRFRNFMGFDRRWDPGPGSEDSHGRALWALGECARSDHDHSRRLWAATLFAEALPAVESFLSPRAWSFTLLGLDAYCDAVAEHAGAGRLRELLANRLLAMMAAVATPDWEWFENSLSYDNARLPQALIVTGSSIGTPRYVAAGLRSLQWLMSLQTASAGYFRPVGSRSFGAERARPQAFDQQPLEAAASISACLAAWRVGGDETWRIHAERASAWFFGRNDLSLPLVDLETGGCCDGLHPDRPNENRGGESAVSYLLSLTDMRQFGHLSSEAASCALQALAGA
ncbi:MAG TPA: glycosyltransferase family 4 protein [Steroidobacteraceae bacterium]|nr:glycosyltransferase family 4 protein [Steroidobacteraceae bacterium]